MNTTSLSMRMCDMMGSMGLGAEKLLLQILPMSFSSLEMVNRGIDSRGSDSRGNIRIIGWWQTLSNEWILRSWKIRIMVVKLPFMLLALHCKEMDRDTSSNPICWKDMALLAFDAEMQVLEWMKTALEKSDCMFRSYAYPGHMCVEFLIIREVSFGFLVRRDGPDSNLGRKVAESSDLCV